MSLLNSENPVHFNGNQTLELQKGNEYFTCYGSYPGLAAQLTKVNWEEKRKSEEFRNAVRRIRGAEPDSLEQKEL